MENRSARFMTWVLEGYSSEDISFSRLTAPDGATGSYSGLGPHHFLLKNSGCFPLCSNAPWLHHAGDSNAAALLAAPNCGASFDPRLGPHLAMSPCFLTFLIDLAVAVTNATKMP